MANQNTHSVPDFADVAPLFRPWEKGPDGKMRPPLDKQAMWLSEELASSCYSMDSAPWIEAGWQDVTLRINGEIAGSEQHDDKWSAIASKFKLNYLQSFLKKQNPIRQLVEAVHLHSHNDTGKAMIMAHPAPDGRTVIAIGFMGTGAQMYDWISNMRMSIEEGTHKGFLNLARCFEENEKDILFPGLARRQGLKKLSLRDILDSMRKPGSPYVLWLAGHSQGGALLQIYARHKIVEDGVLPEYIVGYGFASPTVMTGTAEPHPADYPLYQVVNSDDVVPRMGSQIHLGMVLSCRSDEQLRHTCYEWSWDDESVYRRTLVRPFVEDMRTVPGCLMGMLGFFKALENRSAEDIKTVLKIGGWLEHPSVQKVLSVADSGYDKLLRYVCRRVTAAYEDITGTKVPAQSLADVTGRVNGLFSCLGIKGFMGTFNQLTWAPHSCGNDKNHPNGTYAYIVSSMFDSLTASVWVPGTVPARVSVIPGAPLNRRPARMERKKRAASKISAGRRR